MMRRTQLAFLSAIGLFVAMLVLPRDAVRDVVDLPIDLAGIEVVEVVSSTSVKIMFSPEEAGLVQYPVHPDARVTATREGNRLVVNSNVRQYEGLDLQLPPSVRKLVVQAATVHASVHLDALAIEISDNITWNGDVTELTIIDTSLPLERQEAQAVWKDPAAVLTPCQPYCGVSVRIDAGTINQLAVTSLDARVSLDEVDTIARTTLTFGREARFSIGHASRIPDITLLPHPAEPQAPEAKDP